MLSIRILIKFIGFVFISSILSIAIVLLIAYKLGPPPIATEDETIFYNDTDIIMHKNGTDGQAVTLQNISPHFVHSVILVEDQHFYDHVGFDFKRMIKAVLNNMQSKQIREGASTITQQLAKNLYLTNEKTISRKLKEAFYTIRLEMFYDKETILTSYMNMLYFGHGLYGIDEASHYFFDKNPKDLSIAESAMLAGIPKGPTYYSPLNDAKRATERQQFILQLLREKKRIKEAQYIEAKQEQLAYQTAQDREDMYSNYFIDYAAEEAAKILHIPKQHVLQHGYKVYTTFDEQIQQDTEDAIASYVDESDIQISTVTLDVQTGALKSMVGGVNYKESPFNRATDAKRMVGSTFKPFLYYAALENHFTPSSILVSKPTTFTMEDAPAYEPSNYNDYYANGPITLMTALALSDNVYAVKTNMLLSTETVIDTVRKFGITADLPNVPSLALGTASISLLEMTNGYRTIANNGKYHEPYAIKKILRHDGKILFERKELEQEQVLNEQKSYILTDLMRGMFDRRLNDYMQVTGASISDTLTNDYAGKSGTTDTDSWMIGFSPSLVTGVWTGYDDNTLLQKAEEKLIAKKVWAQTMEEALEHKSEEKFVQPDGLVEVVIDPKTGLLATEHCEVRRTAYFEKGTEPTIPCTSEQKDENIPLWHYFLPSSM